MSSAMSDKHQIFLSWAKENGVELSPNIEPTMTSTGLGMRVRRPLKVRDANARLYLAR